MQWLYRINPYWNFYTDTRLISYRNYKNSLEKKDFVLDIKELYLQSDLLFQNQANLLIGRKNIYDSRSWYYHAPLDTLKIFNKHDLFLYELYAGTRLNSNIVIEGTSSSNKHNLKNIKFVIAHLSYEYFKANKTEFFGIYENTDTIEQRELYWIGLRFIGYLPFSQYNLQYWLDLSKVQGDINKEIFPNDIDGYAYDIGFKYTFNSLSDIVAFSYAYGSGGNKLYTQPYLTNNKSDFLQRHLYFRHYGSFLDPELSNMKIASLYYSHLFQNKQSFLIALHNYKQDTASYIQYFTSRFTLQPNGKSTDIGNEIDCIYGIYYQKEYDLRTIFSYFFGGNAFDTVTTKKDGLYGQINFRYFW
ncbi:MAG: alginate export family protein [Epsilonproteobacteria bacterium]|nr:alginate export family protein [Campylobacterota bacterium]